MEEKKKCLYQSRVSFTLLSDIAQALLLNGLVIYETLDFRGSAVHIRILQGDTKTN